MTSTVDGATRRPPARRRALSTAVPAALTLVCAVVVAPAATARPSGSAPTAGVDAAPSAAASAARRVDVVTLVTGDVVRVTTAADGTQAVGLDPRPDGTVPTAAVTTVRGHITVVPTEAYGLLAAGRLDRRLFDVTALVADGHTAAERDDVSVIVDYGHGDSGARQARRSSLDSARRTVVVPAVGMAAFRADAQDARQLWSELTAGHDADGNPTRLADGASTVMLDGRVHVDLADSVAQIHAPQAWAQGYTGEGTTVAVLDTGIDATHPDLPPSVIAGSKNFTPDAGVTDLQGHGTHVASTIAGTGAASGGTEKGVAPGTELLIGKVLDNTGYGDDSWVLAGMQWAVAQHADIVSMSLGGDADDGSNPLSQAVNELSATSDTLFVIAAGNTGPMASTVTSPGAADAALTVGAVDHDDVMADFSSRGPRLRDGRMKPEVTAPGVNIRAARASGTDLGGDAATDPSYTTISGTSMATPHVAGLAAILKSEHPGWDGEQLKDAIVDSTVPVAGATGFDTGTGRVDVARAVQQDVFAPGTVDLGNYAWPYANLDPSTTTVTYRNTGTSAVTLDLALAAEDGSAESTGSLSLGSPTLTVPAHGTADAAVTVDPTVATPGAYSAVVTASVRGTDQTVRTGVGYQLEPERYDVTITIVPRDGEVSTGHLLGLNGTDEPWFYDQRTLDAAAGPRTVTFRVPPGRYATGVISNGVTADGTTDGVVAYAPGVEVHKNTTIVLDENKTRQFSYRVDRPVVNDGSIIDASWKDGDSTSGYLYYGTADRTYALPSAGLPGQMSAAASWLLSQPEGIATVAGRTPVAFRPVVAPGAAVTDVTVPELNGRWAVVAAGTAADVRASGVSGRVAVVTGSCEDLLPAARALHDAGAVAMLARPMAGGTCAGTITGSAPLPSFTVSAADAASLLAAGSPVAFETHRTPAYVYDLLRYYPDQVPAGGVVDGRGKSVAAVVETYRGLGTTAAKDGLALLEQPIGFVPARDGVANILSRRVSFPSTVTHYLSTGANWERTVYVQDATFHGDYAQLYAPPRQFAGGTVTADTWFGGPIALRPSPLQSVTNGDPPPTRELCSDPNICAEPRDEMFFGTLGAFTDAAGHHGQSDVFSNEFRGRLWADGDLVLDTFASVFLNTEVPRGRHDFRVVSELNRQNAFWDLSTSLRTAWRFTSATPPVTDPIQVLPLLGLDYRLGGLSATNSVRAGRTSFGIRVTVPPGVAAARIAKAKVSVSWNGGHRWRKLPVSCTGASCRVAVNNKAGHRASLRVHVLDNRGRAVTQTVVDAYAVR